MTDYYKDYLGRVHSVFVTKGVMGIGQIAQTYTLTGQVKTQTTAGFDAANTYDGLGRLISESETGAANFIKRLLR